MGKSAAHRIMDGLRDAVAGNLSRVTIAGQTWVHVDRDHVVIPKSALAWLNGEAPAPDGKWFGEDEDAATPTGKIFPRRYWWRSRFRELCKL